MRARAGHMCRHQQAVPVSMDGSPSRSLLTPPHMCELELKPYAAYADLKEDRRYRITGTVLRDYRKGTYFRPTFDLT